MKLQPAQIYNLYLKLKVTIDLTIVQDNDFINLTQREYQ